MKRREEDSHSSAVIPGPETGGLGTFIAVAVVVVTLVVALAGALLWENLSVRTRMIDQARASAEGGARRLGEGAGHAVAAGDRALVELVATIEKSNALGDADALNRLLLSSLPRFPSLRSLAVHDRRGQLVAGGTGFVAPQDVSARVFFGRHRDGAVASAVTVPDRDGAETGLRISRRLESAAGGFAGTVSVLLDPNAFDSFLDVESLKRVDAAGIIATDGRILAAWPRAGGQDGNSAVLGDIALFREAASLDLTKAGGGTREFGSAIVAFADVVGAPIVVATAVSRDRVLARWRAGAWRTFAAVAGIVGAVGVAGTVLAFVQGRRRTRWGVAIRLRDRVILDTDDGVLVIDVLHDEPAIVFANPAFERMSGYSAAEVLGRHPRFLYREDVDQEGVARFRQGLREGAALRTEFRAFRKDGAPLRLAVDLAPLDAEKRRRAEMVAMLRDVAERERGMAAIRQRDLLLAATGSDGGGETGISDALARLGQASGAAAVVLFERAAEGADGLGERARWVAPGTSELPEAAPWADFADGAGARVLHTGEVAAVAGKGKAAGLAVPIYRDGDMAGVLLVVANGEALADPAPDEVETWRAVAARLGAAMGRTLADGRFARVAEAARIGVWEWNRVTGAFFVSANVKSMLGYRCDEIPDRIEAWSRHFHPDDHRVFAEAAEAHFAEAAPVLACEYRMMTRAGDALWFRVSGIAARDATGQVVRVSGTLLDVTERRAGERALAEFRTRLSETQRIARLGYWERDLATGLLKLSPEVYAIFGMPVDTVVTEQTFAEAVHWQERERVRLAITAVAVRPDGERELHFRINRPDGAIRHVITRVEAMRDASGRVIRLVGTLRDVTEQQEAAEALLRAKAQADRANLARSSFLAQMSHELRTPLNSVIGFSDMMVGEILGPLGDAKYREYAEDIKAAGQKLLEVINDILDVSRLEDIDVESADNALDLHAIVAACRETVRDRLVEAGLRFIVELPPVLPGLRVDARRIRQILHNLLTHSIATTPLGGTVGIRVAAEADGGLSMTVFDTGSAVLSQDVLDPLSAGARRAMMGMTVTRALVDLLGGTISIKSNSGEDRSVTVYFSADRVIAAPGEDESERQEFSASL